MCVHFGWCEAQFVGKVVTRCDDTTQNVAHLGFVIDKPQKRLTAGTLLADTEDVFCSRIEPDNQEVRIEKNDARTQGIDNSVGVAGERAAVAGAALARTGGRGFA